MRLPFSVSVPKDFEDEDEEPTAKLDLALERLKAATERREQVLQRCERMLSDLPPVAEEL